MATMSGTKVIQAGILPTLITASETLEAGDIISADGYKADADNARYGEFVASKDCAASAILIGYRIAHISGISGGAGAKTRLYLSDTAGDAAEAVSTTFAQEIGFELSATEALFAPSLATNFRHYGVSGTPVSYASKAAVQWFLQQNLAAAGTYDAAVKIVVDNNAALTAGRLCAMSINLEPKDSTDAYKVLGAEVCTYMASAVDVSGSVHGFFVEMQGAASIGGDCYSLYVYYAPSCVPAGSSAVLRLENNASADDRCDAFVAFVGGKGSHMLSLGPLATQTAWSTTGTPSNEAGWALWEVGGVDRYVKLYDTAPP